MAKSGSYDILLKWTMNMTLPFQVPYPLRLAKKHARVWTIVRNESAALLL